MDLKQLITTARSEEATEIHLKIGSPPIVRQRRFLKRLQMPAVQGPDIEKMIEALLTPDEKKKFGEHNSFEGNIWGKEPCSFSLNLFKSQQQTCAIIRLLSSSIPTFEDLRVPAIFSKFLEAHKGLLILCGPPRSGISSLLASAIEKINTSRAGHLLVMVDQIEYNFEPKMCRISLRQYKKDFISLEAGINFSKRMDVDVLSIGDLRRELPFRGILEYVNGGHFAILTMPNLGFQAALEKIIFSFSDSDREYVSNLLSVDLVGVCSRYNLFNANQVVPIYEALFPGSAVRKIIQTGKIGQIEANLKTAGEGSITFDADITRNFKEGKITREILDGFQSWYRGSKA